ncbi:hypothetical protein [Mycolicibacterium poriferae]|jgi:hypothetical protein|uniref:hypothetical protein n=1 Tax=Mycolicibacterium poriferae TaxID=39694 RepID=UPI0024BA9C6A|nr:hypothetical protein [Mycolicibacterium poriferae]
MSYPTTEWHYAGFGITHPGQREDCKTCVAARQMFVDAVNAEPFGFSTDYREGDDQ